MVGEAACAGKAGVSSPTLEGERGVGAPRPLPPELAAFRGAVSDTVLSAAYRRARHLGVGGDEVLFAAGFSPGEATELLARHLGLEAVATVGELPRWPEKQGSHGGAEMATAVLRTQTVLLSGEGPPGFIVAPQGRIIRRLARALRVAPDLRQRMRLIAPDALRRDVLAQAGRDLTHAAAYGLRDRMPHRSAGALRPAWTLAGFALACGLPLIVAAALAPLAALLAVQMALSLIFLAWLALRLAGCCFDAGGDEVPLDLAEAALPPYSILVPLYKEAASVPRLVAALGRLDYPVLGSKLT